MLQSTPLYMQTIIQGLIGPSSLAKPDTRRGKLFSWLLTVKRMPALGWFAMYWRSEDVREVDPGIVWVKGCVMFG